MPKGYKKPRKFPKIFGKKKKALEKQDSSKPSSTYVSLTDRVQHPSYTNNSGKFESLKRTTPSTFYKQGKTFEKIGAMSAAERSYSNAGDASRQIALAKFAQGKPMGKELKDAAKYERKADKVHTQRIRQVHAPKPPPSEKVEETIDFEGCIIQEKPNVKFEDVVGNDAAKEALRGAIQYPMERPDLYPTGFPTTILLHGPPGCGKTYLAKAVASGIEKIVEKEVDFLEIDSAAVLSRWVGAAEKNVKKIFDIARKRAEARKVVMIFMDELDDLLHKDVKHDADKKVRNQFQREISGFKSNSNLPIFLIGATNKPWEMNDAMVRRFEKRIYVDLPDKKDRIRLFAMYLNRLGSLFETDDTVKLGELAEQTKNYSADDIMKICNGIAEEARKHMREEGIWELGVKPPKITKDDCLNVINKRKSSIDKKELAKHKEWNKKHGAE